jgi:hypothetical protein
MPQQLTTHTARGLAMLRCRWRWQTEVAVARQLSFGKQALRQASKRSPGKIPYQSPPKVERQHVKYPEKKAAIQGQHAGAPLTHHRPVEWIVYVVAMFLGGHVFLSYFYTFNFCYGVSMMPTIFSFGECVCLSKYYRRGRGIAVGDLVSFKHPIKHGEHALKRVIGLPGDLVLMNTPGKSDAMIEVGASYPMPLCHTDEQ